VKLQAGWAAPTQWIAASDPVGPTVRNPGVIGLNRLGVLEGWLVTRPWGRVVVVACR
jgi:hypothetical protein